MQVKFSKNVFDLAFSAKDDDKIIGFDDEISQHKRDIIRNHYSAYTMPYQSIYESEPRKTEYQLQQMLKPFLNKPKQVDYKTIYGLPVVNIKDIGNNSYRGATLAYVPKCLETLKKSGIKRVIDLGGYRNYRENAEKAGLEYFDFDMKHIDDMGFWKHPIFYTKEDYSTNLLNYCEKKQISNSSEYIQQKLNNFDEHNRDFIDKFIKLIKYLQEGYCYIGCEYGTYDTNDALFLNQLFNPQNKTENFNIADYAKLNYIRALYSKLSQNDKIQLTWTSQFDKDFSAKIDRIENLLMEKMRKLTAR